MRGIILYISLRLDGFIAIPQCGVDWPSLLSSLPGGGISLFSKGGLTIPSARFGPGRRTAY